MVNKLSKSNFETKCFVSLVKFCLRLLALLPLPVLRAIGTLHGRILYWMKSRSARTSDINISLCYPQLSTEERSLFVQRSLVATGRSVYETAPIWYWQQNSLENLIVDFQGLELLQQTLAQSAVIAICPHWGNWEVCSFALGGKFPTKILFDERRLGAFKAQVSSARSRFGISMVPINFGGLRALIKSLDQGDLVIILPDQVPTRGTQLLVDFMGVKAQTTTIVHSLTQKHNVEIVMLTIERVKQGFFVRVEPASDKLKHEDAVIATQCLNDEVARVIQRDPTQYQWEYKRFRRVPGVDVYA